VLVFDCHCFAADVAELRAVDDRFHGGTKPETLRGEVSLDFGKDWSI
jgi:hypothetical protein